MSCMLRIYGTDLDIDGFIQKTDIVPYTKYYKGDPLLKSKPKGKKCKDSGLLVTASDADFDQLDIQINDTIAFLNLNAEKLQHIRTTKEIDGALLNFGIELRMGFKDVVFQFDRFPAELLRLAGEFSIDLGISLYPPPDED